MKLSSQEIISFHNEGFLCVERPMIAARAIRSMQSVYDRLFAGRAAHADGNQFDLAGTNEEGVEAALPQIINPDRYAPELRDYVLGAADALVKQLLGPTVSAEIYHAILKPAKSGAATPWHQDEAYWDPTLQYHSVSIWLPLQEATPENGCMCFNRGSHEWEVLEHQSIGGDSRVRGLELVNKSVVDDPVACPLPPGGFTIHRNRTAHYTGPNSTAAPRRALIMGANLPPRPYAGKRRFPWNDAEAVRREERSRRAASSTG